MRIFMSVGEPSGDLHGTNLIEAIRDRQPDTEFVGFGGDRMEAAGCRLLHPLSHLAVMGIVRVLTNAPLFLSLISKADRFFAQHKPDAVVLIDYPGFNFWMARRAHFHGIPVFWFVPPQLWGWAGWRVKKMQRWVDHVYCTLPFEQEWFQERGVNAHFVGHPYFDELTERTLDHNFLTEQRRRPGHIIGLLPGSRNLELNRNFASMLKAAEHIHHDNSQTRFLVACFKEQHRQQIADELAKRKLPVEAHVGRTPEIIELAHSCISVSGSVSLELMYHGTPTTIVYRVNPLFLKACDYLKTADYITLVNLLAREELFPEFLVNHCPARDMADQVLAWINQPAEHQALRSKLAEICHRVGKTGACKNAAAMILDVLTPNQRTLRAA